MAMHPAATAAYHELLDNVKSCVLQFHQAMSFVERQDRVNSTALCFTSQLAKIDLDALKDYILTLYQIHVRLEWETTDHKSFLAVLVPRAERIKWRCLEQFTRVQILTIVLALLIIAVGVIGCLLGIGWIRI